MRRLWRDWLCAGLLLLLPLLLFAEVSLGGKTLLPVDALTQFEPYRTALGERQVQNGLLADLILQNYPWKQFLVESVRSRSLPLWDPYTFSGHPFLANGQHSALYPLTWLAYLLPISRAFGVFTVLQLGIAGLAMYVFARVIRANCTGALIAGIVFELSGFLVVSVVHPMIIAGAAWLPLVLAFVECTITRRRLWHQSRTMLPWALAGAVTLGLQTLAGHAEISYFVVLVTAGYAAWRLVLQLVTHPRDAWRREVVGPAAGVVLTVVLGLGLGGVQLIPFYEAVRDSFRQGAVSLADVRGWAYPMRRVVTFLIPDFFGNPTDTSFVDIFTGTRIAAEKNAFGEAIASFDWGIKNYVEGGAYLGILPLLLAAIAILRPPSRAESVGDDRSRMRRALARAGGWLRHPHVLVLAALAVFSLGCVFGTPLYAVIYALPFFNQSHSPFRWVFPLTVAVSALAGLGVTSVAELRRKMALPNPGEAKEPAAEALRGSRLQRLLLWGAEPNMVTIAAAVALWGGLMGFAGLLGSRSAYGAVAPLVERAFASLAKAAYAFADARTLYAYLVPKIAIFLAFLISGGIVLRVSRCPIWLPRRLGRTPAWQALAVLVVVVDLVAFGAGFNPAVDPALLGQIPPVIGFLKQDTGLWRISTFDPDGRGTLTANTGMIHRLQDVRGYDSMFSAQYARYMGWIEPQGQLPYNRIAPFSKFSSLDSPLTDMLNVKYIVTEAEIPLPKYRQVYGDDAVRVYENLGVAPRAFTLPQSATVQVTDVEAVGEALMTYDPRLHVVVEADVAGWVGPDRNLPPGVDARVAGSMIPQSITSYAASEVWIEATVAEPSWLILTDSFARGWKAFVRPIGAGDDQETQVPIARVAGNFRGVLLDESAVVRFKYSPDSVKIGAFVSFLSACAVVFLAGVWAWRLIYRDRDGSTTVERLAKNSIVPIVLNIFNRAVDFAFAALMLRILGPANAGDYYFAINVFLWFDIVTNFGLNTYLTREVARRRDQARRLLVNTSLVRVGLSLAALPLLLAFIATRQTVVAALTTPASRQAIVAMLLLYAGSLPTSIATGLTALFYAFEKAEYPAAVQSVSTLIKVALQTLVLIAGWGIVGIAGSSIAINLVTLAILGTMAWRLFPAVRRRRDPAAAALPIPAASDRGLRREMMRESWPLMLNHLLAYLFYKVDVYLMEPILGSESLGLYSIGYKLLDAVMVIPSMFTMALFPVISRQAQGDRDALMRFYRLGTKILVLLVLPVALITTVIGREMVLILGGSEYLPGAAVALRLMAWSMPIGWINSITQYVLISVDRQRYLTRAYTVGFSVSLLANLALMSRYGYAASAVLHVVSEAILLVLFVIGMRREFGTIGWRAILLKPLVAASVAAAGAALTWGLGRGVALGTVLIVYPVVIVLLGAISEEDRSLLRPLFRRSRV